MIQDPKRCCEEIEVVDGGVLPLKSHAKRLYLGVIRHLPSLAGPLTPGAVKGRREMPHHPLIPKSFSPLALQPHSAHPRMGKGEVQMTV
jgi:hypothetical protein